MMGRGKIQSCVKLWAAQDFSSTTIFQYWQLKIILPLLFVCCWWFLVLLFALLDWWKRDSILLFHCHSRNLFLQFFIKIVIYLLYNFSDGTCYERDFSCRLKCCFKIICGLSSFSTVCHDSKQFILLTVTLTPTRSCYNFLCVAKEGQFCGSEYLCFHE